MKKILVLFLLFFPLMTFSQTKEEFEQAVKDAVKK